MDEEEIHIAVGKNSGKVEPNIIWAATKFPKATIVLLHVHWPSKWMPFMGGGMLYKFADETEKERHRGTQTAAMIKMLSNYKRLCGTRKVSAYYITHHDVVAGLVSLAKELKIKRIIIGSRYTRNMSKQEELRQCCQVWLVLNGKHISTSSDHVEHSRNDGHGGSSDVFPSHERTQKSREEIGGKPQKKLKELKGESHNLDEKSFLQRKIAASWKKSLSKPRYPELQIPEHIHQFSMSQIRKATHNLGSENIIGEGGYGPVFKGNLGGVPVAIKLLRPHGRQGFPEYQQEVAMLSRLEHPNIVKLIGVCQESCSLVYEHLSNGTLLDRLHNGLPWEDRVRILAEQRNALKYLHSRRPNAIIHADLKLTNILLDAGDVSRLGDFGTARAVHVKPLEEETIVRRTTPMGTVGYMDPVFFTTGELTTESDVYAFGVVVMQLLTGMDGLNIAEKVRGAGKMMHSVLDPSAGPWPEVDAERLLKLALRCCSMDRKQRPAITSDADWKPLDILRAKASPAIKTWKWNCFAS